MTKCMPLAVAALLANAMPAAAQEATASAQATPEQPTVPPGGPAPSADVPATPAHAAGSRTTALPAEVGVL
ncbi:MAG: MotA/TolQ/ExbB proton channel family protein, partial [Candidatus Sericytochromatia bacterium]|nr:MotA/TolQ/ExbB proton channel family protein [Candidatus Tanganyikabacteria bacterium]